MYLLNYELISTIYVHYLRVWDKCLLSTCLINYVFFVKWVLSGFAFSLPCMSSLLITIINNIVFLVLISVINIIIFV